MSEISRLRLFIDSTDEEIWRRFFAGGYFYGVTTNPKLLFNAGIPNTIENLAGLAEKAFALGAQEIHLQIWGDELEVMLARGRQLAALDPRVSVKIPITETGLRCARQLIEDGVRVTLTAVHASEQMLPVIALGAAYAAPYLGRMNDAGLDGEHEILAMQAMIDSLGSETRLLVASIREPSELSRLAGTGCDTFTLVPELLEELLNNPQTLAATADFEEKASALPQNARR
ncbi:MAG: transaldolase family protein [Candidatus Promineifilaceae bacterium]|jgi:transaldolase